jgi:hypothetical protein
MAVSDAPIKTAAEALSWRCFHCGEVFTDERCARLHFGATEDTEPACRIPARDGSLLAALRRAETDAAEAWGAVQSETVAAVTAMHAMAARHVQQLRIAEEAGYERGLNDGRALSSRIPAPVDDEALVEAMARAIADMIGPSYDDAFENKSEWIDARGMRNGVCLDVNTPFKTDYREAARAALAVVRTEGSEGCS